MKSLGDLRKAVVLSDFDGTITTFDTNVMLFNRIGDKEKIDRLREKYRRGDICLRSLLSRHFEDVRLSEEEYLDYILGEVELQRGFNSFYDNLRKQEIPLSIVSGGFKTGIKAFLEKHGFQGIPIYANRLVFSGDKVRISFYDEEYLSHVINEDFYIDSKVEILKKYREKHEKIIFLGDGTTDIHVAKEADVLFAKDYLEKYCIENNIDYIGWEDFDDINRWFNS